MILVYVDAWQTTFQCLANSHFTHCKRLAAIERLTLHPRKKLYHALGMASTANLEVSLIPKINDFRLLTSA